MVSLKYVLSYLGLGLAVLGLAYDSRAVVWAAIAVLSAAVVVRLLLRRRPPARDGDSPHP